MTGKALKKAFEPGHGYTKEDCDAVDSPELTAEELAQFRPAREVLPPEFFKGIEEARRARGRPSIEAPKQVVSIRLDPDVIAKFKATGKGWQSRINDVLKKAKVG